jgi:F-type H+-transporting ATPase subunit a
MTLARRPRWRWGVNRWWVLLFIVLGVVAAGAWPPIRPHVQLPAEVLSAAPLVTLPLVGPIYLTNTLVALFLADLILIGLALAVRRSTGRGKMVLGGMSGALEALLEALYNLTESTAGKRAKRIFPWVATIVLLVLVANWMELIPGVDSVGLLHPAEGATEGHQAQLLGMLGSLPLITIVKGPLEQAGGVIGMVEGMLRAEHGFTVVPFVRVVSTDLNFPLALALISVVMTQVYGVQALGLGYFGKFFNTRTLFSKPMFGAIDFGVGLLELVSEFSKVLSFSFRLFGNIFAGSVLLFVMGSLVPVFIPSMFMMLEFFVGMIQAIVFGMLTLIFMSQATAGHGEGAH